MKILLIGLLMTAGSIMAEEPSKKEKLVLSLMESHSMNADGLTAEEGKLYVYITFVVGKISLDIMRRTLFGSSATGSLSI